MSEEEIAAKFKEFVKRIFVSGGSREYYIGIQKDLDDFISKNHIDLDTIDKYFTYTGAGETLYMLASGTDLRI